MDHDSFRSSMNKNELFRSKKVLERVLYVDEIDKINHNRKDELLKMIDRVTEDKLFFGYDLRIIYSDILDILHIYNYISNLDNLIQSDDVMRDITDKEDQIYISQLDDNLLDTLNENVNRFSSILDSRIDKLIHYIDSHSLGD